MVVETCVSIEEIPPDSCESCDQMGTGEGRPLTSSCSNSLAVADGPECCTEGTRIQLSSQRA